MRSEEFLRINYFKRKLLQFDINIIMAVDCTSRDGSPEISEDQHLQLQYEFRSYMIHFEEQYHIIKILKIYCFISKLGLKRSNY